MTRIAAVRGALPRHRYAQSELTEAFVRGWGLAGGKRALLERLHRNVGVDFRHLALPVPRYIEISGFREANDAYVTEALELGAEAAGAALAAAGTAPADVDLVLLTSTTGVAAPSLDARLVERLGLRHDVKRLPLFGLGCAAGAAGLARVHDYLRGWPEHTALLLSVELCSLTLQRDDLSIANFVGSALFGDGAAAAVVRGAGRASGGPAVVATRSRFYPGTQHVMGWRVSEKGFQVMLDPGIPDLVRTHLARDVDGFLSEHGLTAKDITGWVCHPGGPKVLEAITETLDLPSDALDVTWRSLAANGNLSSASVLHVLRDTLARRPEPGAFGLLLALGPGFCAELVLLRW
ncbi:type III polyketide synthase [Actinocorallia populi]|uniref:type III polyketide synthase n=1 Tax=Actinocorallia populi TaxID=2079200 RepID=UPI000D0890ED|nr:3-oxoacyl-[acyl-carrier-protein] synthase III C-terminal domain-containing protein [Actinocorallia populi]